MRKAYMFLAVSALTLGTGASEDAPYGEGAGASQGGASKDAPYGEGWSSVVEGYRAAVERAGIAGSGLLLVRDGKIAARESVGMQDRERRVPATDETIYHWASITKTFTGIAIMQLRDRGLLSLDDPVVKYVPELRRAHNPFGDIAQVRIRHLMSHSGGFRASTWPWGGDKPWHPYEPTSWDQLAAMLPYTDVQFAPGSKYSYSNPGVVFLGRIIEALSGDDYEVYVTKNILMPLGMRSAFFDRAPYYLLPRRSHSYFRNDAGIREAPFDFDTGITVSNGGLNAPLTDMGRYLAFLMGAAEHAEYADRAGAADRARAADRAGSADHAEYAEYEMVLKRSSLEEMWTPQVRATEGEGVNGQDSHAALSFFVERWNGVELVGHSGDQNGFISHLYLHRRSKTGWVVSFNTDTTASKDASRPSSRQVDMTVRELMLRHVIR